MIFTYLLIVLFILFTVFSTLNRHDPKAKRRFNFLLCENKNFCTLFSANVVLSWRYHFFAEHIWQTRFLLTFGRRLEDDGIKTDSSMRLDLSSLIQLSRSLTFSRPVSLSNIGLCMLSDSLLQPFRVLAPTLSAGQFPLLKTCPDRGSPIRFYYPVFPTLIFSPSRNLEGCFWRPVPILHKHFFFFNFSWDGCNAQEGHAKFAGANKSNKVYYGKCGSGV